MMNLNEVPLLAGVYRLYSGEDCIYVGSTQCLRKRLSSHRLRKVADRWEWQTFPVDLLTREEQKLIDELKPPMNRAPTASRRLILKGATKVPCTASLDDSLLAALDEYAKAIGETRSVVIQRAVRELLKRAK